MELPCVCGPDVPLPIRGTPASAGLDLFCPTDISIFGGSMRTIDLGVAVQIPPGHFGLLTLRSSIARRGVISLGGIIDSDYRDPLVLLVRHLGPLNSECITVPKGARIAQLLIIPCALPIPVAVTDLAPTSRTGGFGSTGV